MHLRIGRDPIVLLHSRARPAISSAKATTTTKATHAPFLPPPNPCMPKTPRRDAPADVAGAITRGDYDAVVFDCDGVLWKGSELIDGAAALLAALNQRGLPYLCFTNNSLRSRVDYAEKFAKLGLSMVTADQIFSSSYAAAAYLAKRRQGIKRAYVVGGQGIIDELRLVAGIDAFGGPEDADKRADFSRGAEAEVKVPEDIGAVVVGVDPALSYWKIHYAAQCLLQNPSCLFVACNEDSRGHFTPTQEWPGAGASVAAVAAVVGRRPDAVVGKPSPFLARAVMDRLVERGCTGHRPRVLMVGDRLDTDVAWAHAASAAIADEEGEAVEEEQQMRRRRRRVDALMVMSGVATDADLEAWQGDPPDYVLAGVWELAEALAG